MLYETEDRPSFKENQSLTYVILQTVTTCNSSEIRHVLVYIIKMGFHLHDFAVLNCRMFITYAGGGRAGG